MLVDTHVGRPCGVSFACKRQEIKVSKLEMEVFPIFTVKCPHFPGEEGRAPKWMCFLNHGLAYSEDLDQIVWYGYQLSLLFLFDTGLVT